MTTDVGARVGPWRLLERLGHGSMGEVWRADGPTGTAALKVLRAEIGPEGARRFQREARSILDLRHPNVVHALDWGQDDDGALYLAMELLEGESLEQLLERRGTLGARTAASIGQKIAAGLAAAHAVGIVHRDVKPANVYVCTDGTVKLLDFGLALRTDDWSFETRITRPGTVLGTPSYMAPEQAAGSQTEDERSDIWALGAVIYHAVAGRPPFWAGGNWFAELFRISTDDPDPLPPRTPPLLAEVIGRALAKDPGARFQSVAEMGGALDLDLEDAAADGSRRSTPVGGLAPATAETVWEGGVSPQTMHEEVRLVSAVVAEGVSDDDALSAFFQEIRSRGGIPSAIRGHRAVGVFGGAEWSGDEAERAVQAALAASRYARRVGVGTGKALLQARGRGVVTGAALMAAASALQSATEDGVGQADTLHGGEAHVAVERATDAASQLAELAEGVVGACPETRRWIQGGFALNGAQIIGRRRGDRPLGVRDVGGVTIPLVGREVEMARLRSLLEGVCDDRKPAAIALIGPPGIGKSRLRHELQRWLADNSEARYLEGRAESTRAFSTHATLRDVFRRAADLPEGADRTEGRARLEALVADANVALDRRPGTADFLGELLGIPFDENEHLRTARADPTVMADRIRVALGDIVDAWTQQRPLVLALEDLQWCDSTSLDLVDYLLLRLQDRPLAVVVTARPEFLTERSDALPGLEILELRELSRRAVDDIVQRILQRPEPAVSERAAGNPYFAEELALAVREGADVSALPMTVEGAVQARLDKLPGPARDTLKRAAVLGTTFWIEALEAMGETGATPILTTLRRRGLVLPRPRSRLHGCHEWAFRHAVVQEVCAALLTESQRMALHRVAARWLSSHGDVPPAEIAQHHEAAGEPGLARRRWLEATQIAHRSGDSTRVLAYSEQALRPIPPHEESEPEAALTRVERYMLHLHRAESWFWLADTKRHEEELVALAELEDALGDALPPGPRAKGARIAAAYLRRCGRYEEAADAARQTIALADLADDPAMGARGRMVLSVSLAAAGKLDEAGAAAEEAARFAARTDSLDAKAHVIRSQAYLAGLRGEQGRSVQLWAEAQEASRLAGQIRGSAEGAMNVGAALQAVGALEESRVHLEAALAEVRKLGSRITEAWALNNLGMVLARLGDPEAGLRAEDQAIAIAREARQPRLAAASWVYKAAIAREAGDPEGSARAATEALEALGDRTSDSIEAPARAVRAGALFDLGRLEESLQESQRALELRDAHGGMEELEPDLLLARYDALAAVGRGDEAEWILDEAVTAVRAKLGRIQDPTLRRGFLHNIPANARLLMLRPGVDETRHPGEDA